MIKDILTTHSRPSRRPDQLASELSHPQLYNSQLATTGQAIAVRYRIDDDVWQSFTAEQVRKQINLLRQTGRFREPNNGNPFVVRLSQYALSGGDQYHDNIFYDFRFDNHFVSETVLLRMQRPDSFNWTRQQKRDEERTVAEILRDDNVVGMWWEKDYLCICCQVPQGDCNDEVPWMAANVVVILLQDRTTNKIMVAPKTRPKLKLKFLQRRPQIPNDENVPEIVLTIPRRVYTSTSGETGKEQKPRRMHFRAGHLRQQQYGPRSAPRYREIEIAAMWINAEDVPPEERGTPITRNYKFKALRAKTK